MVAVHALNTYCSCIYSRGETWRLASSPFHIAENVPILAASGYNNYTKSIWLYLQLRSAPETDYQNLSKQYIDGNGILRGTNFKCWGGISTDIGIQQTLLHDVKSEGVLIRRKGFNSVQRNLSIFSRPLCAEITDSIKKLSSCSFVLLDPAQKGRKETEIQE